MDGGSDGGQGVADIVGTVKGEPETAELRAIPEHGKCLIRFASLGLGGHPVGAGFQSECLYLGERPGQQPGDHRILCIGDHEAISWHNVDEPLESSFDFGKIIVNICVIVLDIINDDRFWLIKEKLGELGEEGAVVLVALDDEQVACSKSVGSGEILR